MLSTVPARPPPSEHPADDARTGTRPFPALVIPREPSRGASVPAFDAVVPLVRGSGKEGRRCAKPASLGSRRKIVVVVRTMVASAHALAPSIPVRAGRTRPPMSARALHVATRKAALNANAGVASEIRPAWSEHHRNLSKVDVDALVEIRARQRTFNGAYARSALGDLGYPSLSPSSGSSNGSSFASACYTPFSPRSCSRAPISANGNSQRALDDSHSGEEEDEGSPLRRGRDVVQTKGHEHTPVLGPPFVTAGWVVMGIVAVTEIDLLALLEI
ncbi:hypothetical protein OF83DRAFT_1175718 [Amylostereum chailletii]|nr:hypothetical protein OF83DRAFT_1175718 [Amylostereum chailletii]